MYDCCCKILQMSSRQHFFSQTPLCHCGRKGRWEGGRGLLIHGGVLLQFVEKNAKTSRTAQKLHFQFIYSHHASKVLSTAALHQAVKIWGSGLMKSSSARNVVSIYKLEVELSSVWVVFFTFFSTLCLWTINSAPPQVFWYFGWVCIFPACFMCKFLECCSSVHAYLVCFHPL